MRYEVEPGFLSSGGDGGGKRARYIIGTGANTDLEGGWPFDGRRPRRAFFLGGSGLA